MEQKKSHQFSVGDIVLLPRGHRTVFHEVIQIEKEYMWVADSNVQTKKKFDEVELICKAEDRHDSKVPRIPFINC